MNLNLFENILFHNNSVIILDMRFHVSYKIIGLVGPFELLLIKQKELDFNFQLFFIINCALKNN